MKKTILDDLLKEDIFFKNNEEEDKILFPLLDEINLICSIHIKSFVRSVLLKAENFWVMPSSFSDEYHPIDERDEGGNVLHTKRVVRAAEIICESYVIDTEEKDMIYAACLLHDITKGIKKPTENQYTYDPFHPYTVEKFIVWCIDQDKKYTSEASSTTLFVDEITIESILRLIRCHLGPWSPIPETTPANQLEMIVHLADNIASKLHIIIDGKNIIEHRWKSDDKQKN
jgi:HD superfamily phosphohydrolase YqeK